MHLLETGPLQPSEGRPPNVLDQQKEYAFAHFARSKKSSIRASSIDSGQPGMANTMLVSPTTANVSTESLVTSQCFNCYGQTKKIMS